jgi:PadR family transcriptional regulator PadR
MKKTKLGEFEELVLLTVVVLAERAYGVEIKRELEQRLGESISVGSIQSSLKRMEEKGFLVSEFGEATQKRGGKRKKNIQCYSIRPENIGRIERDKSWLMECHSNSLN